MSAGCVQVALAAYSEYLFQKFTEFPYNEVVSIDLAQYPPVAVVAVLNFIYTGELQLTNETVGCVWKVADDLGIGTIVGLCEDFLGEPNVDNAVFHFAIAERFGLKNLESRIYEFILSRQATLPYILLFCWCLTDYMVSYKKLELHNVDLIANTRGVDPGVARF